MILIAIIICSFTYAFDYKDAVQFLDTYGYINSSEHNLVAIKENSSDYLNALQKFQDFYNLTRSTSLNKETVKLMQSSRCGNHDKAIIVNNYRISSHKWLNRTITWQFIYETDQDVLSLARKAFGTWEKHANIKFIEVKSNPNIMLSFGLTKHYDYITNTHCTDPFDGKGGTLAHANMPNLQQSSLEIHFDTNEIWNYGLIEDVDKTSLFDVLVHEIGHSLGIEHSNHADSIMYAFYSEKMLTPSYKLDITIDDMYAIQYLYGPKVVENPTTVIIPVDDFPEEKNPDLCDLKNVNTFLVINDRLYIFYKKWVWTKHLNEKTYDSKPMLLTDWLPYIPKTFINISGIYQRPNGNIVIIIDNETYNIQFPSLQLDNCCGNLYGSAIRNITGIVNANNGRTYMFYNSNYYAEISECTFKNINYGLIEKSFPGIPPGIDSVFKYTNGRLYFFKGNNYYEYNEFTGKLVRSAEIDLSIFDINCPNISVLEQLRILLTKLYSYANR